MDWLDAKSNLLQGRVSDPSQDKLYSMSQGGEYPTGSSDSYWQGKNYKDTEALPLGDIADPISQLAFLLAPYLSKAMSSGFSNIQGNAMPLRGLRDLGNAERGSLSDEFRESMGNRYTENPTYTRSTPTRDMKTLEKDWIAQADAEDIRMHAIDKLQVAFPKNRDYILYGLDRDIDIGNIAKTLADSNTRNILEVGQRLSNTPTTDINRLMKFIQTHVDAESSVQDSFQRYISKRDTGYFINDNGIDTLFNNILKPYLE